MNRYMTIAMVMIMVLFTAVLAADYENPGVPREDCEGPHGGGFMQKLELSDAQDEAIQEIHSNHRRQTIDIHADIQKFEIDLQEALREGNFSEAKAVSGKISAKRADLQAKKLEMQEQVYKQLDSDQQKTYLQMISHGNRGMRGGRDMHPRHRKDCDDGPMNQRNERHNRRS